MTAVDDKIGQHDLQQIDPEDGRCKVQGSTEAMLLAEGLTPNEIGSSWILNTRRFLRRGRS